MTITDVDISEMLNIIRPLIGLKAWGVSLGVGSFITLEFGEALSPDKVTGRQYGEWHLWIYCSMWRLETDRDVLVGSEDPRPLLESTIKELENNTLRSVTITLPNLDTVFEFDESRKLRVLPTSMYQGDEYWMLFTPAGKVLHLGPGTSWAYVSASSSE